MGLSFNNLHVHLYRRPTTDEVEHIAAIMTEGISLCKVEDAHEADVKVSVIVSADSQWTTVLADSMDEDLDVQLEKVKQLSKGLKAQTLAVACFDSDYLCLNMVDAIKQVDIWAACGRFPYGKVPRRSNIAAWRLYVKDGNHFKEEMKRAYVCAEDCLYGIADDLSISSSQLFCMDDNVPADCERFDFYYKMNGDGEQNPPCFKLRMPPPYYYFSAPQLVSFVNQGSASKGVMVFLTGACITEHRVTIEKIELQYGYDPHLPLGWNFCPVELKEITFANGVTGLAGEYPDFHIPAAVREGLPLKKKMDLEFQREINVRFKLNPCNGVEAYGPLQVTLIPLKNFPGQCAHVMVSLSEWKQQTEDDSP